MNLSCANGRKYAALVESSVQALVAGQQSSLYESEIFAKLGVLDVVHIKSTMLRPPPPTSRNGNGQATRKRKKDIRDVDVDALTSGTTMYNWCRVQKRNDTTTCDYMSSAIANDNETVIGCTGALTLHENALKLLAELHQ